MAQLCFQLQVGFLTAVEGRKQERVEVREIQPTLGVSLQSISRESLSVQDLEQRNAGALIIVSAAVVEMPLTLASALVRIIITLEDPRQPSKLISCLCRVDGFFPSLWVINMAVGDGGNPAWGSHPGWGLVYIWEVKLSGADFCLRYTCFLYRLPGLPPTQVVRRSRARRNRLLAAGKPSPQESQSFLPGIIMVWIITQFGACWKTLGWSQSREAGFWDDGRQAFAASQS